SCREEANDTEAPSARRDAGGGARPVCRGLPPHRRGDGVQPGHGDHRARFDLQLRHPHQIRARRSGAGDRRSRCGASEWHRPGPGAGHPRGHRNQHVSARIPEGQRRPGSGSADDRSGDVGDQRHLLLRILVRLLGVLLPLLSLLSAGGGRGRLRRGHAAHRHGSGEHPTDAAQRRVDRDRPGGPERQRLSGSDPGRQWHQPGLHPVAVPGASMNRSSTAVRLAALLFVLGAGEARAALPPTLVGVSYQLSVPIGETANYTSPVSWRGIWLDVMTWIRRDLSVGLAFGWNVFFNNTTQTINLKGVDITGNQDRTLNVWPTLVNARWFPPISSNRDIQPYIGANVGGYII